MQIVPYQDSYRTQLMSVWEQSVIATHSFLAKEDFIHIRDFLGRFDFSQLQTFCLQEDRKTIGFIGVADYKIEMLFLLPQYFGQGLGTTLVKFAINELHANKTDVNEQNVSAIAFYTKMGFETYERTEYDDQGKGYPLLRMKLKTL